MKYIEVKFSKDDLLPYLLGDIGFESFIEEDNHLLAYIQQQDFDEEVLKQFDKPYTWKVAEYKDWNEEWERQGFEPIDIDGKILIHDNLSPVSENLSVIDVIIEPRQAFGTGTHQTTRMMLRQLLSTLYSLLSNIEVSHSQSQRLCKPRAKKLAYYAEVQPRVDTKCQDQCQFSLLDCGCGTGILSIAASKLGFERVVGYDIDEWSVENSIHNAQLNNATNCQFFQGDASILVKEGGVEGTFDVVMANINRNILVNDVPAFAEKMHPGSILIVSGFYQEDAPIVTEAFAKYGLKPLRTLTDENWTSILFTLSR